MSTSFTATEFIAPRRTADDDANWSDRTPRRTAGSGHQHDPGFHPYVGRTSRLMKLPDAMLDLLAALKDNSVLVEQMIESFLITAHSFGGCADALTATAADRSPSEGAAAVGGDLLVRLQWAVHGVLTSIGELVEEKRLAQYVAALRLKIIDRLVAMYRSSEQLRTASLAAVEARGACMAARTTDEKVPSRDCKAACDSAKAAKLAAAWSYEAVSSTRFGPAFQNFLLFSVAAASDMGLVWKSRRASDGVTWLSHFSGTVPSAPTSHGLGSRPQSGGAGTPARRHSRALRRQSSFIVRPDSFFIASQQQQQRLAEGLPGTPVRLSTSSPAPAPGTAAVPSVHHRRVSFTFSASTEVNVARPAIDGVGEARDHASTFLESLGRVVAAFYHVGRAIEHAAREVNDALCAHMATAATHDAGHSSTFTPNKRKSSRSTREPPVGAVSFITAAQLEYMARVHWAVQQAVLGP